MLRRLPPPRVLAAVASVVLLGGCGSTHQAQSINNATVTQGPSVGGARVFRASGIGLTFRYPATLTVTTLQPTAHIAGNTNAAVHGAVGAGRYDLIVVTRFPKRPIPVTTQNIASLKGAFEQTLSQVAGRPLVSTVTTVGGLPALRFPPFPARGIPVAAVSRVTEVFTGDDEYELNCQATSAKAAVIRGACDQMLATLATT